MNIFDIIKANNIEAIKKYINEGNDVNIADELYGNTPLIQAVCEENIEIIQLLIDAGANINTPTYFNISPLKIAIQRDHNDIVHYLLGKGAVVTYMEILSCNENHLKKNQMLLILLCETYLKQQNIKNKKLATNL